MPQTNPSARLYNNHSSSDHCSFGRSVRRRCQLCIRIFKWLPVLFIVSVLSWGYYAYVIQLTLFTVNNVILKIVYLIPFHALYVLTMWSYWQTIFTDVAHIPRDFWLPPSEKEKLLKETNEENQKRILDVYVSERNLPIQCRAYNGMYRICETCYMIKPDRAHHCSVCDTCVLKMDHHCPWVNNCVSFSNYKFFIQFLGYAFALCLYSAITSFPYFLLFWKNELPEWGKFHILFLFFVSIMFAISLVSLFGYHIYLVLLNRSTLESFRAPVFASGPNRNAYNLGKSRNFCQVFGENRVKWFLPVYTSIGDGIVYPLRSENNVESQHTQQSFYNSIGHSDTVSVAIDSQHLQPQDSKGSGITFDQRQYKEDNAKLLNGDDDGGDEEANISQAVSGSQPLCDHIALPTARSLTGVDSDYSNHQHFVIES